MKRKYNSHFIKQTAIDYDMEVWEVEKIADDYQDHFYEGLENFINEREVYEKGNRKNTKM